MNPDNTLDFQGPVPEDSAAWASSRIDAGIPEFQRAGVGTPTIFEFPHYGESAVDDAGRGAEVPDEVGASMYFSGILTRRQARLLARARADVPVRRPRRLRDDRAAGEPRRLRAGAVLPVPGPRGLRHPRRRDGGVGRAQRHRRGLLPSVRGSRAPVADRRPACARRAGRSCPPHKSQPPVRERRSHAVRTTRDREAQVRRRASRLPDGRGRRLPPRGRRGLRRARGEGELEPRAGAHGARRSSG